MSTLRVSRLLSCLILCCSCLIFGLSKANALPPSSRIAWQGGSYYLHGANVPWVNWGTDFGGGPNGGGVSSAASQAMLTQVFTQAQASGMHVIRWWTFEGSTETWHPYWIMRDSANNPIGITPSVYQDFDAALALADKYDFYYDFCLFASASDFPSTWRTDPTQRQMLANVLGQLFAHYKGNPRILSWECFNEPEWDIQSGTITQSDCVATGAAIAASVHANCGAYATVGPIYYSYCSIWLNSGMDFYAPHWYDDMTWGSGMDAIATNYGAIKSTYGIKAPIVLGECYNGNSVNAGTNRLETLYSEGYAGAWAWSLLPSQTGDGMAIDMSAAAAFAKMHTDLGPQLAKVPLKAIPSKSSGPGLPVQTKIQHLALPAKKK